MSIVFDKITEYRIGLDCERFERLLYETGHNSFGIDNYTFDIDDFITYSISIPDIIGKSIYDIIINDNINYINVYRNDL